MSTKGAGWSDAKASSWNANERRVGSMRRIPIEGLSVGKQTEDAARNDALTSEKAGGRAVLVVPPGLKPSEPVDVMVHLHGYTETAGRPFAGLRQNKSTGEVRDVELDRVETQLAAVGQEQLIAVLAQGGVRSEFGEGKNKYGLEPNAYAAEVLRVARGAGIWPTTPRLGRTILSVHSGGGHTAKNVMERELNQKTGAAKGASSLGELVLFDALTGDGERDTTIAWITARLDADLAALTAAPDAAARQAYLATSPRFRGYATTTKSYRKRYEAVESAIKAWFRSHGPELGAVAETLWANYQVVYTNVDHEYVMRGADPKDKAAVPESGNIRNAAEALYNPSAKKTLAESLAVASKPARAKRRKKATGSSPPFPRHSGSTRNDDAGKASATSTQTSTDSVTARGGTGDSTARGGSAPETAAVKLSWKGGLKNAKALQPVLDKDPPDLTANIRVTSKGGPKSKAQPRILATGDTPQVVELPVKPKTHALKVIPTATKPGDYFHAATKKVSVDPSKTTEVAITLPYNRENSRFTERTWEVKGIDVERARLDFTDPKLFGKDVGGGLSTETQASVQAVNDWFFNASNVSEADQKAATESIVSIYGRNKRTTSKGAFSNHSIGVAVDINPREDSLQNWHVERSNNRHAVAMRIFNKVVREPGVDATSIAKVAAAMPSADASPFKDFDIWNEKNSDRLLEASRRFNSQFPQFLVDLVARVDPARDPMPTPETVMSLTVKALTDLAVKAKTAHQSDDARHLSDIADTWREIQAWVGGFIIADKDVNIQIAGKTQKTDGLLPSEFDAAKAKDPTLKKKGELTGMISIHPAIVKAFEHGGWSWLVDLTKDFMHFEDRKATKRLTKPK